MSFQVISLHIKKGLKLSLGDLYLPSNDIKCFLQMGQQYQMAHLNLCLNWLHYVRYEKKGLTHCLNIEFYKRIEMITLLPGNIFDPYHPFISRKQQITSTVC